jgi:hypothetical protein
LIIREEAPIGDLRSVASPIALFVFYELTIEKIARGQSFSAQTNDEEQR